MVDYLIGKGLDPNAKAAEGNTPLHRAAWLGCLAAVKVLLESGKADINSKNHLGHPPLHTAIEGGNIEVACYLLSKGADPNRQDASGNTCLHWAVLHAPSQVEYFINYLQKHHKNLFNQENVAGYTPLELIKRGDNEGMVKYLSKIYQENIASEITEKDRFDTQRMGRPTL